MATKKRKILPIHFYYVQCENGMFEDFTPPTSKVLKKRYESDGYDVVLDEIENGPTYVVGNIVRVKKDDIDPKYNTTSFQSNPQALNEDEGIGTSTVFLYYKKYNLLFFQSTREGVSTNLFCNYFEKFTNCGRITLHFVLAKEMFEKLAEYNYINKVDIQIKGLDRGVIFKKDNEKNTAGDVLEKFQKLSPNIISIVLSTGNSKETMIVSEAKKFVSETLTTISSALSFSPSLKKDAPLVEDGHITVYGRQEYDDKNEPIDLIVRRYSKEITVEYTERLRKDFLYGQKKEKILKLIHEVEREYSFLFNPTK